ncbi:hypothetical protein GRF21_33045 [Pseudomonas aeruginosa]|uniref:hypothetical protein n=1 Tax=Pseudomonas aeruginosa TaxID=287 RepID=UPI001CA5ED6D|nr:hypothetical protein [Pseudomonas aeruginosa]MBW5455818.1 hypothetical protein [Pseudomonas aeruginosa]
MSFAAAQDTYVMHSHTYETNRALVDFFTTMSRMREVMRVASGHAVDIARPVVQL